MKKKVIRVLGVVALAAVGSVVAVGCDQASKSNSTKTEGLAERTGAALDKAANKTMDAGTDVAEKTAEAAKSAAAATKEATGKVLEKSGEMIEKAGAATEKAGADMQP